MTHVCPECGFNLQSLEGLAIGPLSIMRGLAFWGKDLVQLTPTESLIVQALAGALGNPVKIIALAEAIDSAAGNPRDVIDVMVCRIRKKFRQLDSGFDAIETVRVIGYRWKVEAPASGSDRGSLSCGVGSLNRTPAAQPHNLNPASQTLEMAGGFQ